LALPQGQDRIAPACYSKSLTNYFIASNQIVNELRNTTDNNESLRKICPLPASKAAEPSLRSLEEHFN
jgi:hypothetical protein